MNIVLGIFLIFFISCVWSYDNGVGITPALGWNTWCSTFVCGTDVCNENEVKGIAQAMLDNGMYDVGYRYINLDDCWGSGLRTSDGELRPDPLRFPSGIKNLTDYLHNLGFKFGLYTSAGSHTCNPGLRPWPIRGSYGHYQQDATTFANWGVDYVKLDWCGKDLYNSTEQHTEFSEALNSTNRPIWLELCRGYDYPPPPYVAQVANSWRVTHDHHDDWDSTYSAILAVAGQTKMSSKYNWAYNDVLMTGGQSCFDINPSKVSSHCPKMTDTEYKTEFSIWAITASPLIVATDIRNMTNIMKEILLNKEIIDINQINNYPAGDLLYQYNCDNEIYNACQIWTRQINNNEIAVILLNLGNDQHIISVNFNELNYMNWTNTNTINIYDLWNHDYYGNYVGNFSSNVGSHGVIFVKMSLVD